MINLLYGILWATLLLGPADAPTNEAGVASEGAGDALITDSATDARWFFELLVQRYRNLTSYSDMSRIVQVIQHAGDGEPHRVETEMSSEVANGALRTETALTQIQRAFGIKLPLPKSEAMSRTDMRYQLWMLPHLTLKFSDDPLRDFRDGVREGFTATDLAPVTVDDRSLVHLELRSGSGGDEGASATFDIYVDPDSMLIERIRGQQRLPDGGNYETTVEITPHGHESDPAADGPTFTGWPFAAREQQRENEESPENDAAGVEHDPTVEVAPVEPNEPTPYPFPHPHPATSDEADPAPMSGECDEQESSSEEPQPEAEANEEAETSPAPVPEPRPSTPPSRDESPQPSGETSDSPQRDRAGR